MSQRGTLNSLNKKTHCLTHRFLRISHSKRTLISATARVVMMTTLERHWKTNSSTLKYVGSRRRFLWTFLRIRSSCSNALLNSQISQNESRLYAHSAAKRRRHTTKMNGAISVGSSAATSAVRSRKSEPSWLARAKEGSVKYVTLSSTWGKIICRRRQRFKFTTKRSRWQRKRRLCSTRT